MITNYQNKAVTTAENKAEDAVADPAKAGYMVATELTIKAVHDAMKPWDVYGGFKIVDKSGYVALQASSCFCPLPDDILLDTRRKAHKAYLAYAEQLERIAADIRSNLSKLQGN